MKVYTLRFNLFLALAFLLAPVFGCAALHHRSGPVAALRVCIEMQPNSPGPANPTMTVSLLRADPVQVTIDKEPILTEANVVAAKVINTPESPAIDIRFDDNGTWILEQYSASNPGRHLVLFAQWGKKKLSNSRWIAAPLITGRINNGILSFTPDMSLVEANDFVQGLNAVAKDFQTGPKE
jgi:preprotein translocase subunit SecD